MTLFYYSQYLVWPQQHQELYRQIMTSEHHNCGIDINIGKTKSGVA